MNETPNRSVHKSFTAVSTRLDRDTWQMRFEYTPEQRARRQKVDEYVKQQMLQRQTTENSPHIPAVSAGPRRA